MKNSKPIYTIGHSNHSFDGFLDLLKLFEIKLVIDVRSFPFSRRMPHFNRKALTQILESNGLNYLFMGDSLGGRPNAGDYFSDGVADYDKMARAPLFQAGLGELKIASQATNATLLCAEQDPIECHRALLVTRMLKQEVRTLHIHRHGTAEDQATLEARLLQLHGLKPSLFETETETLQEAYSLQNRKVGFALPALRHQA